MEVINQGDQLAVTAMEISDLEHHSGTGHMYEDFDYAVLEVSINGSEPITLRDEYGRPVWGPGMGPYDEISYEEMETITGTVVAFDPPLLTLDVDGEIIAIWTAPIWYWEEQEFELNAGELVTLTGYRMSCGYRFADTDFVFMTVKIEKSDGTVYEFQDEDGHNHWSEDHHHGPGDHHGGEDGGMPGSMH